ncbi:MAG: hypothetical protein ACLPYZ_03780 [Limisphaerales bacterium]
MKKPSTLSLSAGGLVLVTTGLVVVCLDDRYLRSGTAVTYKSISRWSRQS